MSKIKGFIIIISIILVLIGGALLVFAITKGAFTKASTLQEVSHDFTEDVTNINVDVDTAEIIFIKSNEEKTVVVSKDNEKVSTEVSVNAGTLNIKSVDNTKWYENLFTFNGKRDIKIYLPKNAYNNLVINDHTGDINIPNDFTFSSVEIKLSTGDVTLKSNVENDITITSSTGDITLEDINPKNITITTSTGHKHLTNLNVGGDVTLTASTGKTYLTDVLANNLTISTDTGRNNLKNTIINNNMTITTSTGDVTFDKCDALNIKVKTSTGDVTGKLLTEKSFYAVSSSGKIDVPKTTGNICEIETSTGDIKITIAE